eukprot:10143574-Karenia_brevis.AAC.1
MQDGRRPTGAIAYISFLGYLKIDTHLYLGADVAPKLRICWGYVGHKENSQSHSQIQPKKVNFKRAAEHTYTKCIGQSLAFENNNNEQNYLTEWHQRWHPQDAS